MALKLGIKGNGELTVTAENTAKAMGSGSLDVLATPALVALVEKAAWTSVQDELDEGQGTVGTSLELKHEAPTPLGLTVKCETELTRIDGRRLVFKVRVTDEDGIVMEGRHERFIVGNEKFQAKADAKNPALKK
ncbi:MAG: thioesterase family protein [Eubacteriales bacterium]|nr:thioesterase family protein [Eubacteriales bacterium]